MTNELPLFRQVNLAEAQAYATQVFSRSNDPSESYLLRLTPYQDGHFRAVFDPAYFYRPDDTAPPSKSQWSTLKKRMKRIRPDVFVFKAHGFLDNVQQGAEAYLDFGFFAD